MTHEFSLTTSQMVNMFGGIVETVRRVVLPMNEFVDYVTERITALATENANLQELVVALIYGQTGECWLDAGIDGDGWNEPLSEQWTCGCGEWQGPEWTQSDPQGTGQPDPITASLEWLNHYRGPTDE